MKKTYNWWTILSEKPLIENGVKKWKCICRCGNIKLVNVNNLKRGLSKSCGCYNFEGAKKRPNYHGGYGSYTHTAWRGMLARTRYSKYKYHYSKGIKVCERWNDYSKFLLDMGERPKNTTLDRIDNSGDYTPKNCRWATSRTQANNRSNNHYITIKDQEQTLTEWSRIYNINPKTVSTRICRGWPIRQALGLDPRNL